jgi:HAD superfamily hydrolase (TIGR01549 family)
MDDAIIRDVKRLCAEIRPCGPLTVQLIRDDRDVDWYIEINPRFGGGAPISMRAGADIAESVLRLISDEPVQRFTHVADGAVYSRFDWSACVSGACGPVRGVVFDLDDTLYPEKDYVRSGFRAVSEHLGGGYEGALWSYFEKGLPAIDELLRALGREDEASDALQAYRGHRPQIQLRSGAREMLVRLRNRGIKVGIITDGRPEGQRNKLEALGLYELVDDVVITDELGGPQFRKPCDIAFRIMQRRWGIPSSQMVYVGDNLSKDFLAPRQLGMGCVYLRDADGLYYDGTASLDFGETVNDFFELGEVLDKWTRSSR